MVSMQSDVCKESNAALVQLLECIDELDIKVERRHEQPLRHTAVVWWNRIVGPKSRNFISTASSSKMIDRVVVNYIRHNLTKYDKLIHGVLNGDGQVTAVRRLHARVLAEIAHVYPSLRDECERQIQAMQARDLESIRVWRHDDQ